MIEKSPNVKLYEQADLFLDEFRESVRNAQENARRSGVDYVIVSNGMRYIVHPDGEIEKQLPKDSE